MSGSAKAGTTAERHTCEAAGSDRLNSARSSEARVRRIFFSLDKDLHGWSAYLGAGPALTFLHQSFQSQAGQGRNIDFGNFDFDAGFNILTGVQFRRGTFFEVKTSLYSRPAPTLRLILGYNF